MPTCATCGNEYEHTFTVRMNGQEHEFDAFECAIEKLAPRCPACGCRIIGHGVEGDGRVYCCSNCARREGIEGTRDSV